MTTILPQYYSDANEAESWMKEKEPLVTSDDYGRDEASAKVINFNIKGMAVTELLYSLIRRHPWIVATASTHSTGMCVLIIPTDAHWAISRAVHVLRLVSTVDSRAERLCILLPASIRPSCIARMYLIQPSLLSAGKINAALNSSRPRLVAALKWTVK